MSDIIQAVRINDKMLFYRETAKNSYGDAYSATIEEYKNHIRATMVKAQTDNPIDGLLSIQKATGVDGMALLLLIAATVEIMEESPDA